MIESNTQSPELPNYMRAMDKLVSLDVDEVRLPFAVGKRITYKVQIKSLVSTSSVVYKVQTTSPKKFGVKPHIGILEPLSTSTFDIVMQPQREVPEDFPISRDKFMVTAMIIPTYLQHPVPTSLPRSATGSPPTGAQNSSPLRPASSTSAARFSASPLRKAPSNPSRMSSREARM